MSVALEIRKNRDGKVQARRKDGKPLTDRDRKEVKALASQVGLPRAWMAEEVRDGEKLQAVKICSDVLEDHLWLVLDPSFTPHDELAIYYPEELEFLKTKTVEELKAVHRTKLTFPGARVVQ